MTRSVHVQNVSKKYQIFNSPRDRMREALSPFRKTFHRPFWALQDISFDVQRGTTLGILGVNGSGKSTLLKILTSVLQPTTGTVEVRGRIAALLELGAGFDRALSGRANAEFHGLLNGYSRSEVRDLMPKIEAFAEIGDFFEQPMQIYSSGMFMRVAFATAIHIDPEILIIDEAMSVGDARFQQKCYQKFKQFQDAGKTIIIVTHDRSMIPRLCNQAILLDHGHLIMSGDPKDVTQRYSELLTLDSTSRSMETTAPTNAGKPFKGAATGFATETTSPFSSSANADQTDVTADLCSRNPTYNKNEKRYGSGIASIVDYCVIVDSEHNPSQIQSGATVDLWVRVFFREAIESPLLGFTVTTMDGIQVYSSNSEWLGNKLVSRKAGSVSAYRFSFEAPLAAGDWFFDLTVAKSWDHICDARDGIAHLQFVRIRPGMGLIALEAVIHEDTSPAPPEKIVLERDGSDE